MRNLVVRYIVNIYAPYKMLKLIINIVPEHLGISFVKAWTYFCEVSEKWGQRENEISINLSSKS